MKKINLLEKAALIDEPWQPHIISDLNDNHVKLAKFKGEFVWHAHENEDEMFIVVDGEMVVKFRTHQETVKAGECLVVPKGVEHMPISEQGAVVLLVEPMSTINTGDTEHEKKHVDLKRI